MLLSICYVPNTIYKYRQEQNVEPDLKNMPIWWWRHHRLRWPFVNLTKDYNRCTENGEQRLTGERQVEYSRECMELGIT